MTTWTPEQTNFIEAVKNTTDSLRLDAVAGSGKTTTLLHAARGLPESQSIIALAFNKNIAEELSRKFPSRVLCKTLNGLGHSVWLKTAGPKRLDSRKIGDIVTKWCGANLSEADSDILWNPLRQIVSSAKSMGVVPSQWVDHPQTHPNARELTLDLVELLCDVAEISYSPLIQKAVESCLLTSIAEAFSSRIDFDDQIYMSTYFSPKEHWPEFDVVMVDEAQDLSRVQHDLIERLGEDSRLIIVGDERQAIYGWRGASTNSLAELTERFGLVKYPLTISFRCPAAVVREAQQFVRQISAAKPRGTVTEWEGVSGPAWTVESFELGSVVLCRNNAPLIKLGFAFIKNNIPCYFTGKDIGQSLKKIVESWSKTAPLQQSLAAWYEDEYMRLTSKKRPASLDALDDRRDALEAIISGCGVMTPPQLIIGIDKLFRKEPSPNAIELSTIHRAKGKEWPTVYFLNKHLLPGKWIVEAVENQIPGADDLLLQEDNLSYVAITRALESLIYFTLNKQDRVYTRAEYQQELATKE